MTFVYSSIFYNYRFVQKTAILQVDKLIVQLVMLEKHASHLIKVQYRVQMDSFLWRTLHHVIFAGKVIIVHPLQCCHNLVQVYFGVENFR